MKIKLLVILVFVLGFVGTAYALHDESTKNRTHSTVIPFSLSMVQEFEPPLKQVKYTHPTNIACNEDLVLRFKYDLKPVCMDILTITDIEKQNPGYFSLFDMKDYQMMGGWVKKLGKYNYIAEPEAFYSFEKPRPAVGTIWWEDGKTEHEIRYLMINGSELNIIAGNNLQDPSDRHTWAINIQFKGDENTIFVLELPDDLELKYAVGMHMNQFDKQNILFPLVEPENKTKRQIIISDVSNEEGMGFVELAFLKEDNPYEITEISLPIGEKYISENSIDLSNLPKVSCEIKEGVYKNNQCFKYSNNSIS